MGKNNTIHLTYWQEYKIQKIDMMNFLRYIILFLEMYFISIEEIKFRNF